MLVSASRPGFGDAPKGAVKRELQRIVAAHSFYNSERLVQNFVMVEAGNPEATSAKLHDSARARFASASLREVWIAKVLAFVRVRRGVESNDLQLPSEVCRRGKGACHLSRPMH